MDFLEGKFKLNNLRILKQFNGCCFADLDFSFAVIAGRTAGSSGTEALTAELIFQVFPHAVNSPAEGEKEDNGQHDQAQECIENEHGDTAQYRRGKERQQEDQQTEKRIAPDEADDSVDDCYQ